MELSVSYKRGTPVLVSYGGSTWTRKSESALPGTARVAPPNPSLVLPRSSATDSTQSLCTWSRVRKKGLHVRL